jgi:hypothetical protein
MKLLSRSGLMGYCRVLIAIVACLVASQVASSPVNLKCKGDQHAEMYDSGKAIKVRNSRVTEGVVIDTNTDRFAWTAEGLSEEAHRCGDEWWTETGICTQVDETEGEYKFWMLYPTGFTTGKIKKLGGELSATAIRYEVARTPEQAQMPPGSIHEKDTWTLICAPGSLRVSEYYDCECGRTDTCPWHQEPPWCEVSTARRSAAFIPPVRPLKFPKLTSQLKIIGVVAVLALAFLVPIVRVALVLLVGGLFAAWLAKEWLEPNWSEPFYVGLISAVMAAIVVVAIIMARRVA